MRIALVAIAAALIVIFASAAAMFVLTGDTIGAGFFLALALISAVRPCRGDLIMKGTYFRWTIRRINDTELGLLHADILGADIDISADPAAGTITAEIPARPMDPDTARMIGVRLIEAAALADNGRSVRES